MNIITKSILTFIAVVFVGVTSANAESLNDRLRKVAKPLIRGGGAAIGGIRRRSCWSRGRLQRG
jgi:hypothetical protein